MKEKLNGLSKRYVTALRRHLQPGSGTTLEPAWRLGHQAVACGLETLELARMHERALIALNLKDGLIERAEIFFTEAITPIVETHRAARQSRSDLTRVNATLSRRTAELAAANRQLQRGIVRRKSLEAALQKSGEHYTRLLKESVQLQESLRQLTHRMLAAQEEERRRISTELQDEVAQALLGVNVRLLSLKREARNNTQGLKKKIASTQQMVIKSARSVRRAARKLRKA